VNRSDDAPWALRQVVPPHRFSKGRPRSVPRLAAGLALAVALGACGGGTDDDPGTPQTLLPPLPDEATFAVLSTDFASTSIGFLDADGTEVLLDPWIDSGTTAPGLVATLGGDVVFASQPGTDAVALVDRFGVDAVLRLRRDGGLIGQVRLSPESVSLNVHDAVVLEGGRRGLASRYGEHPRPDEVAAEDRGSDLIGFDPRSMTPNGERIDLSVFNATVAGIDTRDGSVAPGVPVLPRPSRVVQRGNTLVVGLDRLPRDFLATTRGHGEGLVALIHLPSGRVAGFDLPGAVANCGRVLPVLDDRMDVIVSCVGYSDLGFGEEEGTRATAGIVRLRVDDEGGAEVVSRWLAAEDGDAPLAGWNTVSLGGDLVATVAYGEVARGTTDRLLRIDLGAGEVTPIATSEQVFVFGSGAFLPGGPLLLPDADQGAVRRFLPEGDGFVEAAPVTLGPRALPPRSIRVFR